jgi:DNA-binding NtrC family response regulator
MDATPTNSDKLPRGNETILVIDDESTMLELMQTLLGKLGYRVIPIISGEEALALLKDKSKTVHLVLTDMVLPGDLDGLDVAEAIRASHPGIPICYMTAYPNAVGMLERLGESGRCLQKPFQLESLARVVRAAIDDAASPPK